MLVDRFVHIFFMDGVGLGDGDPERNPFVRAVLPHLIGLLGEGWYRRPEDSQPQRISTDRATLVVTDARLGVAGRPQSATGQATILTGRNVPQIVGEHYGPKPNPAVSEVIRQGNLFQEVVDAGGRAALMTPYPQGYFDAIDSGKRLLSSVPLAATSAGLPLMSAEDLRAGRAISPDFTGGAWHSHLGYTNIPVYSLAEAGRRIAAIAGDYHFSFFEHWPSDRTGHRGPIDQAVAHLSAIDEVLGGLFEAWDDQRGLLIITSDHGNIEEKDHRQHSLNPVPTILVGQDHERLGAMIDSLVDIAAVVRRFLGLARPGDA